MKKKFLCSFITAILLISMISSLSVSAATGNDIIAEAKKWFGTRWGESDGSGGYGTSIDCSALVMRVYQKCGYSISRSTYTQQKEGQAVTNSVPSKNYSNLQLGDLIFFKGHAGANVEHVGIYSGNGNMIHASSSKGVVEQPISNYWYQYAFCVRRILSSGGTANPSQSAVSQKGISNPNQVIRYGQSGTAVTELQQSLNKLIGANLNADGKFGDKTLAVVKQFQAKYGLAVDGEAGPNTNNKINSLLNNQSNPSQPTSSVKGISNPNQVIRYGQSGTAVTELQQSLNKLIGSNLNADGKFGDKTLAAVKQFQTKYGLAVDGDAGPNTNNKINELLNGQQAPVTASIPNNTTVSVNGYNATVNWDTSSNASKYDVYLVQEPWGWEDIKYHASTQGTSYTFNNIAVGTYAAFVIARPNENNQAQSKWFTFSVTPIHEHAYTQTNPPHYEAVHPHKIYEICSCGETRYTGKTKKLADCKECYPKENTKDDIVTDNTEKIEDYSERPVKQKKTLKLQIGIPQMSVNGIHQEIDPGRGTAPIVENDRTLLPIRAVVETFGAYVIWDETEEKITIYTDDTTMQLWVDRTTAVVNGKKRTLDVAPVVINDRTFMPLRFIAENLGLTVGWNEANQTVTIEGEI